MNYVLHLVVYFSIYAIVAQSLNLVIGYCGLLTLAHAGYYAIGAYVYALLSVVHGWGFFPAAATGAVISAVLSLAVSLPSWRLRGDFFVLVSLAVQALIFSSLYNWSNTSAPLGSLWNMTNGPFGITAIPKPSVLGHTISTPESMAGFALIVSGIILAAIWQLTRSPWGRLLTIIRDDELAACGLGKNGRLAKVQAIAISAAAVAVAGALYAAHVQYVDPSVASLDESVLMLSMVIVGGLGNFRGPVLGAAILVLLPEFLRFLKLPDAQAANIRMLLYGLLLVLIVHLRPNGIAGSYRLG
jgi:branched-chain amino acid transport system permease protein